MVRRCCVANCTETDLSILAHRFPKPDHIAQRWQEDLNIKLISLKELQRGSYVVCTKHFKPSDYRNFSSNCLNTTAVPNLEKNTDNERIFKTKLKLKKILSPAVSAKRPSQIQIKEVATIKKQKISPKKNYDDDDELDMLYYNDEISDVCESKINQHEQSTMTEVAELKDQAIQTLPEKKPLSNQSDKDDKIIALLYPKYASSSKIELVKMLSEKDLKIASLEEKEKHLENALASLL